MHQELTPRPLRAVALAGSLVAGLLAPPPVAAQTKEYLYVTNRFGGDNSVVEVPSHKVVAAIPASVVGNSPDGRHSRPGTRRGSVPLPQRHPSHATAEPERSELLTVTAWHSGIMPLIPGLLTRLIVPTRATDWILARHTSAGPVLVCWKRGAWLAAHATAAQPRSTMRLELTPEARACFGKAPIVALHDLHESDLFGDEALADLLDRFPRENLHAITMGDDPEREENRVAEHRGVSGRDLLSAVRQGRLWLNVTRVNLSDSRYRELLEQLFAELARQVPGLRPDGLQATLLVSSPRAMVYFHADGPPSVLWHLRGRKRLFVYPALDERFLARPVLEDIVAGVRPEYAPFRREFDDHAFVVDLHPGQFASWPQNAPHRVTNLDSFNVSLSTEFFTPQSRARARAYAANSFFRNRFGLSLSARSEGMGAFAKVALHRLARKAGLDRDSSRRKRREPVVRVAPDAPHGVREWHPDAP